MRTNNVPRVRSRRLGILTLTADRQTFSCVRWRYSRRSTTVCSAVSAKLNIYNCKHGLSHTQRTCDCEISSDVYVSWDAELELKVSQTVEDYIQPTNCSAGAAHDEDKLIFLREDQKKKTTKPMLSSDQRHTLTRRCQCKQLVTKHCKTMPIIIVCVAGKTDGWGVMTDSCQTQPTANTVHA